MSTGSSGSLSIPGMLPFGGGLWAEPVEQERPSPPPLPVRRAPIPVPLAIPVGDGTAPLGLTAIPVDADEATLRGMLRDVLRRREFVVTVVSSAVHMVLIILLALWQLQPVKRPAIHLTASVDEVPVRADLSVMPQMEIPTAAAGPQIRGVSQPTSPIVAPINLGTNAAAPKTLASLNAMILGDVAKKGGAGGTDAVTFFNSTSVAKRIAFVVDASSSMEGVKFERAKEELLAAVSGLNQQQRFYVYFFSDKEYPMFAPRTPSDMVQLDGKNWEQLLYWVGRHPLVPDTRPRRALQRAFALRPDVVYLLTDGDFNDDTYEFLMRFNNKKVRVNTIGFQVGDGSREVLKRIADRFGGEFTEVN